MLFFGKNRKPKPWLSRKDIARINDYRTTSSATFSEIFIKDNGGSSWINWDYPNTYFFQRLGRRFENLPQDWQEVTELVLQLSALDEKRCANIRTAVANSAKPGGCYTLAITPKGYAFRNCVDGQVVAQASF